MLKKLLNTFRLGNYPGLTPGAGVDWRQAESSEDDAPATRGIAEGTRIASERGWVPVEALSPGDRVLTFDSGLQPITQIERTSLRLETAQRSRLCCPLAAPAGALGNEVAMLLLPRQRVLMESDLAEDLLGDPFALVEAAELDGFRGITRIYPAGRINVCDLQLADEQVIYANGSGLLHCPAEAAGVVPIHAIVSGVSGFGASARYQALNRASARQIVADLKFGDAAARSHAVARGSYAAMV